MQFGEKSVATEAVFDLAWRAEEAFATSVSYPLWALMAVAILSNDSGWLTPEEKREFRLVLSSCSPSRSELPSALVLAASAEVGDLLQIELHRRRISAQGAAIRSGLMRYFVDHSSTEKMKPLVGNHLHEGKFVDEARMLGIPDWVMRQVCQTALVETCAMYGSENGFRINPWWKEVK